MWNVVIAVLEAVFVLVQLGVVWWYGASSPDAGLSWLDWPIFVLVLLGLVASYDLGRRFTRILNRKVR